MKKMYKKPIVEHAEMLPQNIICASNPTIVGGGNTNDDLQINDPVGD